MTVTQVNLTERGENAVISKKKRSSHRIRLSFLDFHHQNLVFSKKNKKGFHLESDYDFLHFLLKFVTTTQEGSSLLKSSAHRSFSFMHDNLQAFATHPHSLGNPLLGRDPWFKKH